MVDDGGSEPLETAISSFKKRLNLTLLTQKNAGPAKARNTGAAQAKGRYLAVTDDDCITHPDWLKNMEARFSLDPECALGGRVINSVNDNIYSTATHTITDYMYAFYNSDPNHAFFVLSYNFAMPVELFQSICGFSSEFTFASEDRDICDRILQYGYRLTYAPDVIVYHTHVLTFCSFCTQHFRYGRGGFSFHRTRAQRRNTSVKFERLSFYKNLVCYPFSQNSGLPSLTLSALLIISQIAILVGFVWEGITQIVRNLRINKTGFKLKG